MKKIFIIGIENRLEQVIANLLDNAISFSDNDQKIEIDLTETSNNFVMTIKDQGPALTKLHRKKFLSVFIAIDPQIWRTFWFRLKYCKEYSRTT